MRTSPSELRRPTFGNLLPLLAAALFLAPATYATDALWTNIGSITVPPQIDAINVVNSGVIDIFTDLPFETSNTQNVTNSGSIYATPGWFFNNAPTTIGERRPLANFVNKAPDSSRLWMYPRAFFIIGQPGSATTPSYLWVSATNIVNQGRVTVGAGGWLKLVGDNVNLTRGGVEVTSIIPVGSENIVSNYFPDAGIFDIYWGGTNIALPPGIPTHTMWDGTIARPPTHDITVAGGFGFQQRCSFAMYGDYADTFGQTNGFIAVTVTNIIGLTNPPSGPTITNLQETNIVVQTILVPTNVTRQAAFVGVSDPATLSANIYWHNSSNPTNVYKTPEVELVFISDNNVSGSQEYNTVYVYDTLASETDLRGLLRNVSSPQNLDTYRPANYLVSRLQSGNYGFSFTGDGYPDRYYLWDPSFTNRFAAAEYAAYGAYVANIPQHRHFIRRALIRTSPAGCKSTPILSI